MIHVLAEAAVSVEVLFWFAVVALIVVVADVVMSRAASLLHVAAGILATALVLAWWP